jgi:phenylacetate-CoA ligase
LPRWLDKPLYRNRLGGYSPPGGLSTLPFITKHDLRADFPHNFLAADGPTVDEMVAAGTAELEFTSGTSDDRVPVLLPRGWWDAQEELALRLNPVIAGILDAHPEPRRATLTTPVCNGQVCPSKWLTRVQRTTGRTLFINHARIPFLLTAAEQAQMAEEVADWQPLFLDLDPVHGAWFALYCERLGIKFPSLKFIVCSYEFVSSIHRRIIERVFGVPVLNLYGATEAGHLMMQGEDGIMLASHESAFLEVVEQDDRHIGPLVVTSLSNHLMPLVRYRIGDLVEVLPPSGQAYRVHGRARDALHAADGRRVTTWDVDQCFAGVSGVAHYQLRQAANGECVLRWMSDAASACDPDLDAVRAKLQDLLGLIAPLSVDFVEMILPAQSGKFRLTCAV